MKALALLSRVATEMVLTKVDAADKVVWKMPSLLVMPGVVIRWLTMTEGL